MNTNAQEFAVDSSGVIRSASFSRIPGLIHGFGARHSEGWPGWPSATVKQIHSDRVILATAPGNSGEADGLVTDRAGFVLAVRTADCVPILIADPQHHAVAAVHAGWRGAARRIAMRAVEEMRRRWGSEPASLIAAVGPAIGRCCFEVGPEVASEFATLFPERDDLGSKTYIDLPEANRRQLVEAGIREDRIASAALCTRCDAALFHSYRRDRELSGRMVSAIGWSA
jgi:YfiH family protein